MFSSWTIAVSFIIILLSSSQLNFSLAELLYGGLALNSGILLAYINDLQLERNVFLSNQTIGRRTTILNISTLIGGNIGTLLFDKNYNLPLYFSIIGLFLYPIIVFGWTRLMGFGDNSATSLLKQNRVWRIEKFSINKLLLHISLLNLIFEIAIQFILVYWSIYFVQKLNFNLSFVYTLMMLSVILGSEIYVVGSKKLFNHNLLILSVVVMGLSVIFIGVFESKVFSLFFFSLFELCTGIFTSSVHVVQNRALLKQEHKSKTLSIIDFSTEIVIIICLQFINFGMKLISIKLMFIVSGCLLFPIATLVGLCLRGRKEKNGIL